ncbi:MAG: hypothetical protein K9L68_04890, partial [Spirochaetales bacterium]|nr:hypothetical protein [Spirochaetales bacterium]MCF7937914.1 hypothetical protein [Spirochaetales bacterium]
MKRFVVLTAAIFLLGLSQQAWTQTLSPFEEEAPTTLFQADLADENVDLLIEGFWDSSLSWSTTWAFGPDGLYDSPLSFPGMEPGIIFKQVPDLVLSLWYMDRYFFETTITEDYEYNSSEGDSSWGNERDNTYVLGYMGREGELVRWVRIGNVGIGISPHRFLRIPDSHTSSPGAAARFETADSYHEFMVRFDPTDRETRTYRGTGEVNDERLDLGAFERGRYFILPDDEVENLSVYIQDDEGSVTGGDGRKYRRAVADDAVIDPDRGTVFLKKKAPGRVLVYYTKGGAAVGDGTLGGGALAGVSGGKLDPEAATVDFDWWVTYLGIDFLADRQVTVDGDDCLTIYEPGGFNPFQLTNRYRPEGALAADSASNRLALVERGETDPYRKDEFFFRPLSDEGVFEVYQAGTDIRDPKNRFPFAGSVDSLDYPFLYQPGLLRQTVGEEILVRTVTPADSFAIPSSAIPGSVRILRNGVEETRYEVDYDSGRITFFPYIHPADEIEISYSLPTSGDTGGDVLAATGHEFRFSENLSADLAAALRWNLEPGSFSERPGQHPGTLTASGGLSYAEEDLQASFDLGVSYSSPDTTGYLRLFGMEGAGYSVEIGSENIFPASVPSGASFGTLTPAAAPSFSNRGRLIYKNYYRYDAFGGAVLQDYTWDPPEDQVYPYTSGSKPGPYAADTGSSSIDGNAMVLDFEMDSGQDWVGAQIPVARGSEPLDLSQMEAIQFSWLTEGISDNVEIYLQVGAASEDLDGDG